MHGLAVYLQEGLPFACDLSEDNSEDSNLFFRQYFIFLVNYLFYPCQSFFCCCCFAQFLVISHLAVTEEVFSINPSGNVFIFEDFNVYHKDWLDFFCRTDRPVETCFQAISSNLIQMMKIIKVICKFLLCSRTILIHAWFLTGCVAAVAHINPFFHLKQQN